MTSRADEAELALRINAALMQFWTADDTADELRAIEIETWLDALDGCTVEEWKAAWRDYQRTGPRSQRGVLLRPDAGAIWRLIVKARSDAALKAQASLPPPPVEEVKRQRVLPHRAMEILAEVYAERAEDGMLTHPSYTPRRFGSDQAGE